MAKIRMMLDAFKLQNGAECVSSSEIFNWGCTAGCSGDCLAACKAMCASSGCMDTCNNTCWGRRLRINS